VNGNPVLQGAVAFACRVLNKLVGPAAEFLVDRTRLYTKRETSVGQTRSQGPLAPGSGAG
jgi:hypothetical protein